MCASGVHHLCPSHQHRGRIEPMVRIASSLLFHPLLSSCYVRYADRDSYGRTYGTQYTREKPTLPAGLGFLVRAWPGAMGAAIIFCLGGSVL